jgi:CspA family cold shock protein
VIDTGGVAATGTVRERSADKGFGVIDSAQTPGGCWAHFSVIVMDGYRTLTAGQRVLFTFERADQDGFSNRASRPGPTHLPARDWRQLCPGWNRRGQDQPSGPPSKDKNRAEH